MVTSVITQYRILKFVAVNVGDTTKLRKPLRSLHLGSFENLCTVSMDTLVIEVIFMMVKRSISSVPIVTSQSNVINVKAKGFVADLVQIFFSTCLRLLM